MPSVRKDAEEGGVVGERTPRAVVFDFNGTLCDDEPVLLRLFTAMFREHLDWTLTPEDYYGPLAGRSDREIVETAVARSRWGSADGEGGSSADCDRAHDGDRTDGGRSALVERLLAERSRRYREAVAHASPIGDGAVRLVRHLAGAGTALGVVTGAQRADVEFVLADRALDGLITTLVAEEDVRVGKPDPEGFLIGARELGVRPADTVVFEDSVHGLRAARAAGMTAVGVTGTAPRSALAPEADDVVDALGPELLESLPALAPPT